MYRKFILCVCAALLLLYSFLLPSFASVTWGENGIFDGRVQAHLPLDTPDAGYNYFAPELLQDVTSGKPPVTTTYNQGIYVSMSDVTFGSGAPFAVQFTMPTGWWNKMYFYFRPRFDALTGITQSQIVDCVNATGYLVVYWQMETYEIVLYNNQVAQDSGNPQVQPSLDIGNYGGSWVLRGQYGDLVRYVYTIPLTSPDIWDAVSDILNGTFAPLWRMDISGNDNTPISDNEPFDITMYFSNLLISSNPDGPGRIIDSGMDVQLIVQGLENVEEAVRTSVAQGASQISSVIVQETQKITDGIEQQTETLITLGSDVDMSVTGRDELTSVQEQQEAITNEIYQKIDSGEVEIVVSQQLMDLDSDNFSRSGFTWVGSVMQRTFDLGFGELIVMCLTLGVALFVIGRKMG